MVAAMPATIKAATYLILFLGMPGFLYLQRIGNSALSEAVLVSLQIVDNWTAVSNVDYRRYVVNTVQVVLKPLDANTARLPPGRILDPGRQFKRLRLKLAQPTWSSSSPVTPLVLFTELEPGCSPTSLDAPKPAANRVPPVLMSGLIHLGVGVVSGCAGPRLSCTPIIMRERTPMFMVRV